MEKPMTTIAEDVVAGTADIAVFIGKTVRQTQYLLETRQIPAFKLGGRWHLRRSRYVAHIEQLEEAEAGKGRAA